MALSNVRYNEPDGDPGYIDETTMESLCGAVLQENLSPEEMDEFVASTEAYDIVTERTIVKLDKAAKKNRAYKLAVLKCAAQDNHKILKKLRMLWKLESVQFKKLEKLYHNKANAMAKEAMKKAGRSKSKFANTASNRAMKRTNKAKAPSSKNLGGVGTFIHKGINRSK